MGAGWPDAMVQLNKIEKATAVLRRLLKQARP